MENQITLEQARNLIYSHDLTPTIRRMVLVNRWSEKQALEASKQYRNYLFLKRKYGNQYELPPSLDIDEFWHTHILHTENYYEFCKKVFGHFLHHSPHHGRNNELTDTELEEMFEKQTQRLYLQEFGDYIYAIRPTGFRMRVFYVIENFLELFFLRSKKLVYKS